jgi:hypothetical protein
VDSVLSFWEGFALTRVKNKKARIGEEPGMAFLSPKKIESLEEARAPFVLGISNRTWALGILFMTLRQGYAADAYSFLFGSILAVSKADVWAAAGLLVLAAATLPLWGRWAYATFDREIARAEGKLEGRTDGGVTAGGVSGGTGVGAVGPAPATVTWTGGAEACRRSRA